MGTQQIRRKFSLTATVCAAFLAGSPAIADVKAGVDAWSRGDYAAAIREWKGPAAQGDADAQFNLAQAYKLGRGVERDLVKAEKLFGEAAAKGHLQAADNYGLMLFQRGERAKAMPYIHAASERGDPRAQYVLGLAYFNGDSVPKDWVRAYALASLAQQAGLPQATGALSQMDQYIPLEDRQRSVSLAAEIAAKAEATRRRQVASADLGVTGPGSKHSSSQGYLKPFRPAQPGERGSAASAGADFTLRGVPKVSKILNEKPTPPPPAPAAKPVAAPAPAPVAPVPVSSPASKGAWRVQLGAFGVPGNAAKLWDKVSGRPELAGHGKLLVPAGRVTKLQAGGFASREAAQNACNRLKSAGFECLAVRN